MIELLFLASVGVLLGYVAGVVHIKRQKEVRPSGANSGPPRGDVPTDLTAPSKPPIPSKE